MIIYKDGRVFFNSVSEVSGIMDMVYSAGLNFDSVTREIATELGEPVELNFWDYFTYIEQFEDPWKKLIAAYPDMERLSTRDMIFEEEKS